MNRSNTLKSILWGNALFSALSGTLLLFGSHWLASIMHISTPSILQVIGVGLLIFAGFVGTIARRPTPKMVRQIILQDWLWVIGSVAILLTDAFNLSQVAYWMIGVVAVIVADFAFFQQRYLRQAK